MTPVTLLLQVLVVAPGTALSTIGAALAKAPPGARIVVRAGTYHEQLVVARRVTLEGEGMPVIDGGGEATVITITADSVVLRGFVVRNVRTSFTEDRAAIRLEAVTGVRVEDNEIRDAFFGIYAAKSRGGRITGNRVLGTHRTQTNSGNAIHLWSTRDMVVEGNEARGHRDGIYLEFGRHAQVRGNTSEGNSRYGLHFMFSDSSTYERNVFRENGAGVAVMYAREVAMRENRFEGNRGTGSYGLLLKEIKGGRVAGNRFRENTVALYAEGCDGLDVTANEFARNGWAVKVMASTTGGHFHGNAFLGNTFDVVTNSRSTPSVFEGNYWGAYRGYDLDRDGYGDVAHQPVRLFAYLVERYEPAALLLRSFFADLLDAAERVLPLLTPETLVDARPLMRRPAG